MTTKLHTVAPQNRSQIYGDLFTVPVKIFAMFSVRFSDIRIIFALALSCAKGEENAQVLVPPMPVCRPYVPAGPRCLNPEACHTGHWLNRFSPNPGFSLSLPSLHPHHLAQVVVGGRLSGMEAPANAH